MFEQVTAEAAQTVGANAASLARFDEDGTVTFVGGWSETGALAFPVGSRLPVEETGVLAAVRATGEPQRIDRYEGLAGAGDRAVHELWLRVGCGRPIKLGGQVWGALVAAGLRGIPFAVGSERQLTDFAALVAQALANAEAYTKLASSRARIVEAADTERRRLERNLHDGAQQRLVSLALQLQLVRASLRRDPEAAEQLVQIAADDLKHALAELRELARGIHPAVLSDRGLAAALRALADARPSRSRSRGSQTRGCPMQSRRRSTISSQKRSPMSQSTRKRRTQTSPSSDHTGSPLSSSATMASEVRNRAPARDSSASPIGSRRSAGASVSKAHPAEARTSPPRFPATSERNF